MQAMPGPCTACSYGCWRLADQLVSIQPTCLHPLALPLPPALRLCRCCRWSAARASTNSACSWHRCVGAGQEEVLVSDPARRCNRLACAGGGSPRLPALSACANPWQPRYHGELASSPHATPVQSRLAAGDWVHIFPEGTRSRDGRMLPVRCCWLLAAGCLIVVELAPC